MIFSSISASSLLALLSAVSALSIPSVAKSSVSGVLELPFKGSKIASGSKGNLTTRGDDFQTPLTNFDQIGYFFNIKVGTPPQEIDVVIDTGSSDLVIIQGKYPASKSSTSKSHGSVNTQWGAFELYNDTVATDLFTLKDYNFATWENNISILGLGPKGGEQATTSQPGQNFWDPPQVDTYDNFPYALVAAGYINKPAFSIYLEHEPYNDDSYTHNYTNGVLLFGGIDHAKYEGELVSYPIDSNHNANIQLNQIIFADGSTYVHEGPAYIDTGTTNSAFPTALVDRFRDIFGPYDSAGNIIHYNESWNNEFFEFDFGSNKIKVPYSDFVTTNFNGGYKFAAISSQDSNVVLGDIFLRNAYTVYNYASSTISVAQAAKNAYNVSDISVIT